MRAIVADMDAARTHSAARPLGPHQGLDLFEIRKKGAADAAVLDGDSLGPQTLRLLAVMHG